MTTSLKVSSQPISKGGVRTTGTRYVSTLYLGKPWPSKLAPGVDGSLNTDLECQCCKDTDHLKENCIKLNCQLAQEQKNSEPSNTVPPTCTSNSANYRLLCLRTRGGEQPRVVQKILSNLKMFFSHYPAMEFWSRLNLKSCNELLQNALR